MSRLIDADVIYQWYRDSFDFEPNEVKFSMLDIRNNLENIPTADVPNMTGDLISRQTALSTIEANQGTLNKRRVMKILEGLPSACNETKQQATVSSDLIDREDTIDAIQNVDWYHQNRNKDMVLGANSDEHQAWYKAEDIYKTLEELPSAKPEPCDFCIHNDDCEDMRIYCPASRGEI